MAHSSENIDTMIVNGKIDKSLLEKAYKEVMALTVEIAHFIEHEKCPKEELEAHGLSVVHSSESLRMSSCLMQSISWFMVQIGVLNGELTAEEAGMKNLRLGGSKICEGERHDDLILLPEKFQDLSNRARDFYSRVARLDKIYYEQDKDTPNPVHMMMKKFEENNDF